jgi:hypothetical protein
MIVAAVVSIVLLVPAGKKVDAGGGDTITNAR